MLGHHDMNNLMTMMEDKMGLDLLKKTLRKKKVFRRREEKRNKGRRLALRVILGSLRLNSLIERCTNKIRPHV